MHTVSTEEKCPLLLMYVDDGDGVAQFPRKITFTDGRTRKVVTGAARVIHQWPEHVSSCWMTAIVASSILFLLTMMFLVISMNPIIDHFHMRCPRDSWEHLNNHTVHLAHFGSSWTQKQLEITQFIAKTYSDFEIHVNVFEYEGNQEETKLSPKHKRNANSTREKEFDGNIVGSLFENIFQRLRRTLQEINKERSIDDLLQENSNIEIHKHNFLDYFSQTPLRLHWTSFKLETLMFAVRVQEVWQYGGISFHVPLNQHDDKNDQNVKQMKYDKKYLDDGDVIKSIIVKTKPLYKELTENLVSLDEQGLHMASVIPCHSVFAELLRKLQKTAEPVLVPDVINSALKFFCKNNGLHKSICKTVKVV